jgi:diguanylate cyclase (GGDEF)-like protein
LVKARTQELEVANGALREASLIDPLTALHNRRFLTMTMPEESVRLHRVFRNHLQKGESPLGRNEDLVLFLGDLDHFKRVNDTYGHGAGDLVLQETAKLLREVCRTSDTLVRWGGEEFLLVAKRSDREKAHLIAEKLCQALRAHEFVLPDGQSLRCTISVGYAAFPILDQQPEAFTWEDTLQVADQCMYAAKHAGRDGWVGVHTPGPLDTAELGPRLRVDLEGLVRDGHIQMRNSFPEGAAFSGQEITFGN